MHLRQLAILGFKSFAQKTELNFPHGVAAVVGPNGCGKSNILDAIRWALGEQSAKALRGAEMADVIFNGTDSRQPLGVAEVSLTFTGCEAELGTDYNEVCITRRVYRDGRGEYLLNKTVCRLRDIQELFMDTGIGRSAYSIMEQGKLDMILSARPEDRRAVFEEAAGITKYKVQRREASRKLEQTEANLMRLTDVIGEVKRQLGSLQRQAAKARRHQTLSADLRVLETHLGHVQFIRLEDELEGVRSELTRMRAEQAQAEADLAAGEARLGQERAALENLSSRLQDARAIAQEARDRLLSGENQREFNRERAGQSQALSGRYEVELTAAEEKLRQQDEELLAADEEQRQTLALLQAGERDLRAQETLVRDVRAKRLAAEQALQTAQRGAADADQRLIQLSAEMSRFHQQEQAAGVRAELLATELARLEPGHVEAAARVAAVRAQLDAATAALRDRRDDLRSAEEEHAVRQKELSGCEQALTAAQKRLADATGKLEVLRQLNAAGAGLASGTQAVLRGLDKPELFQAAIAGVLGTLIEVEPRFIPAIEAILGQNLQAVLLRDREVATALLDSLANGKKVGRATLAIIDPEPAPSAERSSDLTLLPDGALSWAADAVTPAPAAAAAVRRLLAGCLMVEDLETAHRLRPVDARWTIATLAGEVLGSDGFWQGGQGGEAAQGVLARQGQIRKLTAEIAHAEREAAERHHSRTAAAGALQTAAGAVDEARQRLQAGHLELSTLQSQCGLLEREARDLSARAESIRREQEDTQRRSNAAREEARTVERRREEKRVLLERFDQEQNTFAEQAAALRTQESTLDQGLNDLRVRVATEQQRQEGMRRQRQPMAARRAELAELIADRRRELDEHRRLLAQYAAEAAELTARIESARGAFAAAEEEIGARRQEHAAAAAAVEELDAALRGQTRELTARHDRRSAQEVREAQLNLRLENLREHAAQRYHIELRDFQPDDAAFQALCGRLLDAPAGTPDWQAVETVVRGLRERLEGLGAVNVDAIAEYDALEERHQFLETQNADLIAARQELLGIIAKINATSRDLFAETFERIRVNFQEMYTELFGGGRANLLLSNEADPLECGIEIIARPPGKQLQSVSLLSGGEKTMTAVALLFAIYMVKPSPFCVLDEMDAPLDESNISRFLKILDRFVSQSQFIVITHNKRTIARADVLYGITMEEAGVSKVVAVRLSRREEEAGAPMEFKSAGAGGNGSDSHHRAESQTVAESFGKSGELHRPQPAARHAEDVRL
jgi:chromosome segregation protein